MSIAVLHQVYDETRRLAIAGSAVAPGDFRLKKLLPALEQAGAKSPVFAKLAQAASAVIDSTDKTASPALLELGTLITSILYTQGETGISGQLEPIDSIDVGLSKTQTPAKLLKPLLESLTTKGSGRMEVIRTSFEQGLFQDLRLVRPALMALDDAYSEIAEFVSEKVLPLYGPALLPELEAQFHPKGKGGQPRRLRLMYQLDPVRAQTHVRAALEEGNADLRVAAIECLGSAPDDLPFLLEQAKSKAKEVRRAALTALARMKLEAADQALIAQIEGNDLELAREALRTTQSAAVVAVLVERTRAQVEEVLGGGKPKAKAKSSDKNKSVEKLMLLLSCLEGRVDDAVEALHLELFKSIDDWRAVKGNPSGEEVADALAINLSQGTDKMQHLLCKEHKVFSSDVFGQVFLTACQIFKPEVVFKEFSPYLVAYHRSPKKKDVDGYKGEHLENLLSSYHYFRYGYHRDGLASRLKLELSSLSKKWLELAIELNMGSIITQLATLDKQLAQPALTKRFDELMKLKVNSSEFWKMNDVLEAMIQVEHPGLVESMLEVLKKLSGTTTYQSQWLIRHVGSLPASALPQLEALLPSLSEKIANQVIDYMVART